MKDRFGPINKKCPHFLHGGDYNPEQWLQTPEILQDDIRLMKLAGCNVMTVGVFSWVSLEPEEGKFNFGWLDNLLDGLAGNDIYVVLATPSGARPAWMSHKYPEVLRVNPDRKRIFHGNRHNHCFTSPVYREKCRIINTRLAERYKDHPALLAWHISNEYSGDCHCELCREEFRKWLRQKYNDSLDKLNHAWWTAFWSHTYTDWRQLEPPSRLGEGNINGLMHRPDHRFLQGRNRAAPRADAQCARHHKLYGHKPVPELLEVRTGDGRCSRRQLSTLAR